MKETSELSSGFVSQQESIEKNRPIKQATTIQTILVATACATSSFIVEALFYPFDTVKARLQTNKEQFIPFFKAAKYYYKQEGLRTFFKGFSGAIPCTFLYNFVWFFSYEKCNLIQINLLHRRNLDPEQRENIKGWIPFVSGAVSELASMFMYIPFSIPKLRMQVDNPKYYYKNLIDGLIKVYQIEGVSKFYKTSQLEVSSYVFHCGILMLIYENLRKLILDTKTEKSMNVKETLLVTLIANVVCGVIMNPFEVIISRFIIASSQKEQITYRKITKDLLVREGFGGFFKGLTGRLIYGLAHAFAYMPTFEYLRENYGVKIY